MTNSLFAIANWQNLIYSHISQPFILQERNPKLAAQTLLQSLSAKMDGSDETEDRRKQPLDKIIIYIYQLLCFPNYLEFIKPSVTVYHALTYQTSDAIKIYHMSYCDFLHFIYQCCQILEKAHQEKPPVDIQHEVKIEPVHTCTSHNLGYFELKFSLKAETNVATLLIMNDSTTFEFDRNIFPALLAGISRLTFKSFSYSPHINYLVASYIRAAPINLIQEPHYAEASHIFSSLHPVFIDWFLLFEIISRHKKVLAYVKKIQLYTCE